MAWHALLCFGLAKKPRRTELQARGLAAVTCDWLHRTYEIRDYYHEFVILSPRVCIAVHMYWSPINPRTGRISKSMANFTAITKLISSRDASFL
jgi:hypothetical protein